MPVLHISYALREAAQLLIVVGDSIIPNRLKSSTLKDVTTHSESIPLLGIVHPSNLKNTCSGYSGLTHCPLFGVQIMVRFTFYKEDETV